MPRSDELLKLIAAKRANPYSPSKSVAHLRAESLAAATDLPLPEGTHVESLDAGGTPADWVVAPSSSPPSSSWLSNSISLCPSVSCVCYSTRTSSGLSGISNIRSGRSQELGHEIDR
mmetsp:Transcript_20517/g.45658  ORF Transcript_20517/g.45658 Transcript_20517/m.45658 type:complete len:117 (+) Transcript_20517:106-456(+)